MLQTKLMSSVEIIQLHLSSGLKTSWSNLVWTMSRVKALIKEFNSIPILNLDITHFLFISKRMSIRKVKRICGKENVSFRVTLIFSKNSEFNVSSCNHFFLSSFLFVTKTNFQIRMMTVWSLKIIFFAGTKFLLW